MLLYGAAMEIAQGQTGYRTADPWDWVADAIGLLERDAQAAGVRLHVLWDARDGLLDARRIAAAVPQWREADVWFCGPAPFGQALRRDLLALGLPAEQFHHELFEMR